jgi:hypothetical protein
MMTNTISQRQGQQPADKADKAADVMRACMRPGDGFVTSPSVVAMGVSDASIFFNQVIGRAYIAQVGVS